MSLVLPLGDTGQMTGDHGHLDSRADTDLAPRRENRGRTWRQVLLIAVPVSVTLNSLWQAGSLPDNEESRWLWLAAVGVLALAFVALPRSGARRPK